MQALFSLGVLQYLQLPQAVDLQPLHSLHLLRRLFLALDALLTRIKF